jgi:UvrD-like helicase C-terminal domain
VQNRGYATLGRIVDHFAQLVAGGDESNAIVDAIDAVNLMTVHAAKGLEFPVVFVVNMNRGSGGSPDAIRVVAEPGLQASVAIGEYESAADNDIEAREAEESKRLLYVALTRARDRLYLAATLTPDGRFVAGKGGLGRTLPPSLAALFCHSASIRNAPAVDPPPHVVWAGGSGEHRLRVLTTSTDLIQLSEPDSERDDYIDDFRTLSASAPHRRVAIGFEDHLADLFTDSRHVALHHRTAQVAAEAFPGSSSDIVWQQHDVPFSLQRSDGTIVRGSIDCLVKRAGGPIEVVVFTADQDQPAADVDALLNLSLEATRALFPKEEVIGRVVDAGFEWQLSRP